MNKQKNISWLTLVVIVIAVLALVLAIVAISKVNKANMTGQGIFDFLKKKSDRQTMQMSQNNAGTAGCEEPALTQCNNDCAGGDPDKVEDCMKVCGETYCENTAMEATLNQGLLGAAFLLKGGDKNSLKGYEVKYDDEGEMIYEIRMLDGKDSVNLGSEYSFGDPLKKEGNMILSIYGGSPLWEFSCFCEALQGSNCVIAGGGWGCHLSGGSTMRYCVGGCDGGSDCYCTMMAQLANAVE